MTLTEEHLERLDACIEACEGIPTEALKAGVVRELMEAATNFAAAIASVMCAHHETGQPFLLFGLGSEEIRLETAARFQEHLTALKAALAKLEKADE